MIFIYKVNYLFINSINLMPKKIIGYIPSYKFVYEIETEMEDEENFEEEFLYRPNYWCLDVSRAWLKTNHPFKVIRYIDITTNNDFDITTLPKVEQRSFYKIGKKYYQEQKLFFLTYETAFLYNFYESKKWYLFPSGYTGIYKEFYESGQLKIEFYHNNGEIIGEHKAFSANGKEIKVERKYLFDIA